MRDGAEAIVVSTNNRSYRRSANSEQHLALSQMRAAETGRPVLQASVSGISAVIDPDGTVRDRTELFEKAIVDTTIVTTTGETLYVRFGDWVVWGVRARGDRGGLRRDPPSAAAGDVSRGSGVIAATRPTTTIITAQPGAGQPPADVRAELAADDRPDRDEHRHLPRHVGGEHEHDRGDAVGDQREHVLHRVEPLQVVGDEDPEQREQDHALRGAEVAAVDTGEEHPDPEHGAAVLDHPSRFAGAGARPPSRLRRGCTITSAHAIRISTGTTASNTELGSVRRSTAPVMPPMSDAVPSTVARCR